MERAGERPGMAVAAAWTASTPTEDAMDTHPSPQRQTDTPSSSERRGPPVQTGALPGGQPGVGVNTSASPTGQSNADAAAEQGVEYGKDNLRKR